MKVLLFVVLALAACVSAQVSVQEKDGKWRWEVANDGKVILKSGDFDSKQSAVRSAVALLANGADKERCDATLGVTNVNGAVIGKVKKALTEQQTAELQQDQAQFNASPGDKVDCDAVHKVIRKQVEAYVATHSNGEDIAKTGLKIVIEENKEKKEWNFHIKARNGEIVLRSEQYKSKANAEKGIAAVLVNGGVLAHFSFHQSPKDKQWYFNVKSNGNHKIVGAGEGYVSKENAKRGLEGVKDKVRKILRAILDSDATEQQQQKKDNKPEQQKDKAKAEQQARKKQEQQKAKNQQQQTPQTLPSNDAQAQRAQNQQQPQQAMQQQPQAQQGQAQAQQAQAQQQGQQQQARAQLDDNDVTDDDATDEDGDDDDEADE